MRACIFHLRSPDTTQAIQNSAMTKQVGTQMPEYHHQNPWYSEIT